LAAISLPSLWVAFYLHFVAGSVCGWLGAGISHVLVPVVDSITLRFGDALSPAVRRRLVIGYMVAGVICVIAIFVGKDLIEVVFGSSNCGWR
jgi:hypothetical protein